MSQQRELNNMSHKKAKRDRQLIQVTECVNVTGNELNFEDMYANAMERSRKALYLEVERGKKTLDEANGFMEMIEDSLDYNEEHGGMCFMEYSSKEIYFHITMPS